MARQPRELVPCFAIVTAHEQSGVVDPRIPDAWLRGMPRHDLPDVLQLGLAAFGKTRIALHAFPRRTEIPRGAERRPLHKVRARKDAPVAAVAAETEDLPAAEVRTGELPLRPPLVRVIKKNPLHRAD